MHTAPLDRRTTDEGELACLAEALADALRADRSRHPTGPAFVLDLRGALGAGKTTFVRLLGRALGIPPEAAVTSPSFTLACLHPLPALAGDLLHVDAWRLGGAEDLPALGFQDGREDAALVCVEWGGRVEEALPVDRLVLTLDIPIDAPPGADGLAPVARALRATATGPRSRRVLDAWSDA